MFAQRWRESKGFPQLLEWKALFHNGEVNNYINGFSFCGRSGAFLINSSHNDTVGGLGRSGFLDAVVDVMNLPSVDMHDHHFKIFEKPLSPINIRICGPAVREHFLWPEPFHSKLVPTN